MVKAMKRQAVERRQRCFCQIRGATTSYPTLPTIPSGFHVSAIYYGSTTLTMRWWVMCVQIKVSKRKEIFRSTRITVSNTNTLFAVLYRGRRTMSLINVKCQVGEKQMNHMSEAFWGDKRRLERRVIKLMKHLCDMQIESSHTLNHLKK